MTVENSRRRKPQITLCASDHQKLTRLAETKADGTGSVFDELLAELERARVVSDASLRADVVRMGTTLTYSTDTGESRRVSLVYPGVADISAGKVSILTPIGAALIGLAQGQSIDWEARDGRIHRLTIENVEPASADDAPRQAS
jgi:regulator of nucleoside diphosphate kinase